MRLLYVLKYINIKYQIQQVQSLEFLIRNTGSLTRLRSEVLALSPWTSSEMGSSRQGKAFPSGLLRAALPLPAGDTPATPPLDIQPCQELESALNPPARPLLASRSDHGSFKLSLARS